MRAIPSVSITSNAYKESYRNRCLTDYCQSPDDKIRQLHRISLSIDEVSDAQYLTSGNETLKSFDIVAACPRNAKAFSHLCKQAHIDIINIDFTHKIPFQLNKKLV